MSRPTDAGSFGETLYTRLEPLTYDDENQEWALLVYCGAIGQMFQQLHDLTADTEDRPGWSNLLDIEVCPADYLPFLGQFVGATIPTGSDETTARDIVRTHSGFQRGTRAALEAAVAATLTGTKTVRIIERDEDPYYITVLTDPAETPDPDATLAAALTQKPGGLVLNHYLDASTIIDELEGSIDDLAGIIDDL